jgi:small subunit ribosomal protein S23
VQRQQWLIEDEYRRTGRTPEDTPHEQRQAIEERAYDRARKEFYALRLREDVEREVAREEALHFGAHFRPSENERSLAHEDQAYDFWREWARATVQRQRNLAAGKGTHDFSEEETAVEADGAAEAEADEPPT